MTYNEAYQYAIESEKAFQDELERAYGSKASVLRYKPSTDTPELSRLRQEFHSACRRMYALHRDIFQDLKRDEPQEIDGGEESGFGR